MVKASFASYVQFSYELQPLQICCPRQHSIPSKRISYPVSMLHTCKVLYNSNWLHVISLVCSSTTSAYWKQWNQNKRGERKFLEPGTSSDVNVSSLLKVLHCRLSFTKVVLCLEQILKNGSSSRRFPDQTYALTTRPRRIKKPWDDVLMKYLSAYLLGYQNVLLAQWEL